MDWMRLWLKYRMGFWVEIRMVFQMMWGAGRGKLIVGYGVVVHLVVRSLWEWSRKDWKECGLVSHRVYRLGARVGNLYDRKMVFIKVVMDRFRMRRMMDGMRRQVMLGLLTWVIGGRRGVAWLIVLLRRVMLLWRRMRRRSSCWFICDSRSETGVVLQHISTTRQI